MQNKLIIEFEDNHLLVCNKPANLLTQASGTQKDNLEDQARSFIKTRDNKPGNVFLHAIHRLDKDVSGLVLFAKTSKALSRLSTSLKQGLLKKTYLALVSCKPEKMQDTLIHYLSHGDHKAHVENPGSPQAKKAILSYIVLKQVGNYWLVKVDLQTGRYHQIRAQFAAIGCPLVGDKKYGSKIRFAQVGLHHAKLSFQHPISQNTITVTAAAPFP